MFGVREKAICPGGLDKISVKDHEELKLQGRANHRLWDQKDGEILGLLRDFRKEIKTHYWFVQGRRCCYCSKELDAHQGSYDAEHILPKVMFPQFMFEFSNLAIVCKTCNGRKSDKNVCSGAIDLIDVPSESDDYLIVHPHIDEWSDYFFYDGFGRVVSKDNNQKGIVTIEVCGIGFLNAARLSDHFQPMHRRQAQKALEVLCGSPTSPRQKKSRLKLLRLLVEQHGLETATPILDLLEVEFLEAELVM